MTNSEFKSELKALNVKLMESTTREEHSAADSAINALVDSFRAPACTLSLQAANSNCLLIQG